MLLLAGTAALLQLVTAQATTLTVHVSYVDLLNSTVTPSTQNTSIAGAATTTIASSPAASTQRNLKAISINNALASAGSNQVTVQHTDGTTTVVLAVATLNPGDTLQYTELDGWSTVLASGALNLIAASGRLIKTTLLTTGTSFTTGPGTNSIRIRGVGGGGGGAGCTSVASAAAAGGGGGGGGYLERLVAVTPNTAYAYTIGAAGAGASGALGGSGTNSTFVVGATTYTAKGGTGAPVATASATLTAYPGGAGAAVSTLGDTNTTGQPGENGLILIVTPVGVSGGGGSSNFGGGGVGITAVGNGNAGGGFGAGGSGSMTGASAVRTGGSGTAGCWIVDEYS
jgi:hypothetical protein